MTYAVVTTHRADADLRSIYEYIAFELLTPDNLTAWKITFPNYWLPP